VAVALYVYYPSFIQKPSLCSAPNCINLTNPATRRKYFPGYICQQSHRVALDRREYQTRRPSPMGTDIRQHWLRQHLGRQRQYQSCQQLQSNGQRDVLHPRTWAQFAGGQDAGWSEWHDPSCADLNQRQCLVQCESLYLVCHDEC
jgi:hypothetical protein